MVEKRSVKLVKDFIRFHKNKITEPDFPSDRISRTITTILSIYWDRWDDASPSQKKAMIAEFTSKEEYLEKVGHLYGRDGSDD